MRKYLKVAVEVGLDFVSSHPGIFPPSQSMKHITGHVQVVLE